MKKISVALILALAACMLCGCQSGGGTDSVAETLSFSQSASIDHIKELDGKTVSITGYMATISPLNGKYIYLMNLPYQSCPFCLPNTTQLSNTMAVYSADGTTFDYTDQPIRITGRLEAGDYTDDFGYVYNYRIVDARYETVDLSEVSAQYAMWQTLAESGVVADVNAMFDYLLFVCQWTEYMSSYVDESGAEVSYYLYPGDVEMYLEDTGINGYAAQASEDYFPSLIERVNAISAAELTDLTQIISDAQALESRAREELANGNYTYSDVEDKYTLNSDAELYDQFYEIYGRFSQWLTNYEL